MCVCVCVHACVCVYGSVKMCVEVAILIQGEVIMNMIFRAYIAATVVREHQRGREARCNKR